MGAEAPRIDWDAVTEEATQLLADFIRIDTSNPPGRERAACDWLAEIFHREGINDVAFYDASDGSEHGAERMNMAATKAWRRHEAASSSSSATRTSCPWSASTGTLSRSPAPSSTA